MNCKYKVNIKDIQYNYKVKMEEIQSKYKFNIFCRGYDDSDIKGKINDMYNAWPKVTGEGEEITLNDTVSATMPLGLKGNTYQDSTTGKNIADSSLATTYTWNTNENLQKLYGQVNLVAGTTYYFSYTIENATTSNTRNTPYIQMIGGTTKNYETAGSNYNLTAGRKVWTFTVDTTGTYYYGYWVHTPSSSITVDKMMISTSNDTTYEPYTNGASPNPDYPQEVHTVSGDNEVEVRANNNLQSGEELYQTMYAYNSQNVSKTKDGVINAIQFNDFNYRPIGTGNTFNCYANWKPNTRYTIRVNAKRISGNALYLQALYTDGTNSYKNITGSTTEYTELRFLTAEGKTIERIGFSYGQWGDWLLDMSSWFIGEGNVTTYPEYEGVKYSVNLGTMELCKIGNYQDYIYKQDKKWYKYGVIGKVVYNGSESWRLPASTDTNNVFSNLQNTVAFDYISDTTPIYSNNFIWNGKSSAASAKEHLGMATYISGSGKYIYFVVLKSLANSSEEWNNWLSTHNTTVYYVLLTPETIEITDPTLISQLEALAKAESYTGQTNISQVNNDAPFIITASTLKDLSSLGTSTVSTLNTASVNRLGTPVLNQSIDPVNLELNSEDLELNNEEETIEETPEER